MEEKRRFKRILFSTGAVITGTNFNCKASLLDLSLKGSLVLIPEKETLNLHDAVTITITLPSTDIQLSFKAVVAHCNGKKVGLKFTNAEIDSISHLKRLMELNTGNAEEIGEEMSNWLQ